MGTVNPTAHYDFNVPNLYQHKDTWGALLNENWVDIDGYLWDHVPIDGSRAMTGNLAIAPTSGGASVDLFGDGAGPVGITMQYENAVSNVMSFAALDDSTVSLSNLTTVVTPYIFDNAVNTTLASARSVVTREQGDARFLQLSGAAPMVGALTLAGTPTADLHAATKEYVDDAVAAVPLDDYLALAGGNMDDNAAIITETDNGVLTVGGGANAGGNIVLAGATFGTTATQYSVKIRTNSNDRAYFRNDIANIEFYDNTGALSGRIDAPTADATHNRTIMDRQKGDARYFQQAGGGILTSGVFDTRRSGNYHTYYIGQSDTDSNQVSLYTNSTLSYSGFIPRNSDGTGWQFTKRLIWSAAAGYWAIGDAETPGNQIAVLSDITTTAAAPTPAQVSAFSTTTTVTAADQWEYDRQQNIIDTVNASLTGGTYTTTGQIATAERIRDVAQTVQNRLINKYVTAADVEADVIGANAAWEASNPRPPAD